MKKSLKKVLCGLMAGLMVAVTVPAALPEAAYVTEVQAAAHTILSLMIFSYPCLLSLYTPNVLYSSELFNHRKTDKG